MFTWFRKFFGEDEEDELPLIPEPNIDWDEIDDFLFESKKVNAIKSYRRDTGVGLKEAKAVIDERYENIFGVHTSSPQERAAELTRLAEEQFQKELLGSQSPATIGDLIKQQVGSAGDNWSRYE